MVLDNSTLQILVDSVRVLDDMLLVLDNILLVRRRYPRKSHIKWRCSVVSLFLINSVNVPVVQYENH